jgi:TonB family protein
MAHLPMASVMTTDFVASAGHADTPPFSLIEQKGLLSRLARELSSAWAEISHDPRGFIRGLLSATGNDAKRRQRIYLGLALGATLHIALIGFIAVLGWRTMFVKQTSEPTLEYKVTFPEFSSKKPESAPDVPKGEAEGGGSGGQHAVLPASKGQPPLMLPRPQIVDMTASKIPEPSLPVTPTVIGPETPPPPPAPVGDPSSKNAESSAGPGSKGGIGGGDGTGVGSRGRKNGGPPGSLDGSDAGVPRAIDFARTSSFPGYKSWSWIHRQRAIVTREAADNKVMGTVLLRATFNADGTITDIEVVMPVDFMNESAVEALSRSTFHPATINGVPVTVRRVLIKEAIHY